MGSCSVCGNAANLRCTGCRLEFYCGVTHQRSDWPQHKVSCRSWRVESSPELGRHLITTRDLAAGDLVLSETPLAWGPALHSDQRVCVGCGDRNVTARCSGCSWHACKASCAGLTDRNRHGVECALLSSTKLIPQCDLLLPLRMLLIYKRDPRRWATLASLESHSAQRGVGTEAYEETESVVERLRAAVLALDVPKNVVTTVCGLIDVNGLETNPPEGCEALYATACLLEHCCLANTRHSFSLDGRGRPKIYVHAARPIHKGEHLSTTYTHVLWTTRARREHLLATKYFSCKCERCRDVTELGSHLGTLRCPCGPGLILPKDPLDVETEWNCNACPGILSSLEVLQLTDRLGEEVDSAMGIAKQPALRDLLSRLSVLLHPGHQHCIALSHSLLQLLEPSDPQKIQLCRRVLETTSLLDPHGARLALYSAVALRELASCPSQDRKLLLTRAHALLASEPAKSPGENLRHLIDTELLCTDRQ